MLSGAFSAATFDFGVPLLFPFDFIPSEPLITSTAFLASTFGTSLGAMATFSSVAVFGVSISGIESSTTAPLFFLVYSEAEESDLPMPGRRSSSLLKLVRRVDDLGSPLVSLLICSPIWPLFSTITKLVRILERGRGEVPLLAMPAVIQRKLKRATNGKYQPDVDAGERPLSAGGLVSGSLFSNIARRLRTPPDILPDFETQLVRC